MWWIERSNPCVAICFNRQRLYRVDILKLVILASNYIYCFANAETAMPEACLVQVWQIELEPLVVENVQSVAKFLNAVVDSTSDKYCRLFVTSYSKAK